MRLYIIGNSNDDKGTQLEELTATLMKESGYEYIRRNVIDAGGSEKDVNAKRTFEKDGSKIEIPVICECKAKSEPININDWLKFVGKVSIGRMNNPRTEGVMIALNGVNGNVTGNYDALPDKSYLRLIEQEDLLELVCRHFKLKDVEEIKTYFTHNTTRPLDHIDLVYYDKQVWWIVSFSHDEFTIVSDSFTTIEDEYLDEFLIRLANYTTFKKTDYVDVLKEEKARLREELLSKGIVYLLMKNGSMELEALSEGLLKVCDVSEIGQNELQSLIDKNPFVTKECESIRLKDSSNINFVEFYKWYDSGVMFLDGIATNFYVENVNEELLESIIKIQENLDIPDDKKGDCLYIMTLSPRALLYALRPDEVIVNSRKMGADAIPQVNRFHCSYFMNQLADCFLKNLQDSGFSTFYCRKFGLDKYSIETEMSLRFVDAEHNKKINYNSYIGFLNANGQVAPILLFEKPNE